MPTYQLSIENDNRKEITVESFVDITNDIVPLKEVKRTFFHEEYSKANLIVKALDVARQKNLEKGGREGNSNGAGKEKNSNGTLEFKSKNNIIVFSGDRGTGKTSAMVSFGKYLETIEKSNEKSKYKLLDMVDPSYFRKNESILLNIITLMFKIAKQYHEEDCRNNTRMDSNRADFNELLKKFEKVFRSVKRMDSIVPKEDSLEYLNELSEAIDLKKTIHGLIEQFLKFFEGAPQYLVLMIDDLDMNVSFASLMLEQIRKFLIHDNVIILIATNINQLQFEMKEYYSKYYDKILDPDHLSASVSVSVDVEDMATKYLLKLFPPLQRIHIGDAANKLIDTKLEIKGVIEEKKEVTINDELQRVILNLIWKKTRLIFIPDNNQLHPIIPTNLRALHQLIYLLLNMDPISKEEKFDELFNKVEEYEIAKNNFNKFKDYILNVWIPSNVSFDEQKVFDNIPKDISRINKHLIQSINVIGSKNKKSILVKEININQFLNERGVYKNFDRDIYTFVSPNDPKFSNANKISDIFNFPSNNSMGDILLLIDKYKTYFEAANQNNFIEAIKIYYSLLLFETMFFKKSDKEIEDEEENKMNAVKKISNIQRLIGGNLYFPHYFNIINSKEYKKLKEDRIKIEKDKIDAEINAEADPKKDNKEKTDKIIALGNKIEEDILGSHLFYNKNTSKKGFRNFFHILYFGETRPERSYGKHIYDTKKTDSETDGDGNFRYRFDILSLLVNSLNSDQTLARFRYKNRDNNINDELDKLENKIKIWKDAFSFGEPFILPIYSVDLMLKYLKSEYDASDLVPNFSSDYRTIQEEMNEIENKKVSEDVKLQKREELKNKIKNHMESMEAIVRGQDFIFYYYKELNDLTTIALKQIEHGKDKTISTIYNNIYEKGRECFIGKEDKKSIRIDKLKEIFG